MIKTLSGKRNKYASTKKLWEAKGLWDDSEETPILI